MTAELTLLDGRAGYGSVEVLHGVTMVVPTGAVTALVGRNGAGKSSVLRVLAGLVQLRSGRLTWAGRDATRLTAFGRSVAGLSLVPDEHGIFTDMTVEENLGLFAGSETIDPALAAFPELAGRLGQRAGTLSGGEQQMLALSRAFLRPGRVLLLDEPSRGLSPAVTARCYESLRDLVSADRALVVVEQYLHDVLRLADVVYVLTRGRVSFAGEPGELGAGAAGTYGV